MSLKISYHIFVQIICLKTWSSCHITGILSIGLQNAFPFLLTAFLFHQKPGSHLSSGQAVEEPPFCPAFCCWVPVRLSVLCHLGNAVCSQDPVVMSCKNLRQKHLMSRSFYSVILIAAVFNLDSSDCSPPRYICLWVETESAVKWGPCSNHRKVYKSHKWFLWIILQYLVTHPPDITM